jgi:NAD(P)-dependent dehydrogenase (short-subunit alcohol dehydrogenase family)
MKTIFITGVSSGLGRTFAAEALAAGHRVVGTVRRPHDAESFTSMAPGRALARLLDVTDDAAVFQTVDEIETTIGPIDVLIANAGYGVEGIFEETALSQLRAQFATNVFGVAASLQAVLPYMRQRRAGHLMAVTSMAGLMAVAGMSAYCASKFAVEGLLESIRKEVASFGIHVTAIEPGSFRTNWAGGSMTRAERSIPDYDDSFNPIREARIRANGHQLGDPVEAARAVLAIINENKPPAHLVLGSDALRLIGDARAAVDKDIHLWETLSRTTDFPDGAQIASA